MTRFTYEMRHVPGKLLYAADTLSRAPTSSAQEGELQEEAEIHVHSVMESLPMSECRLKEYSQAQATDHTCSQVIQFCQSE